MYRECQGIGGLEKSSVKERRDLVKVSELFSSLTSMVGRSILKMGEE
jgi:hypothetical protein